MSTVPPRVQNEFFFPLSRLAPIKPLAPTQLRVEMAARRAELARPTQPGVQLGEIRQFSVGGKHYAFVIPVTAVFEVGALAGEILGFLRPAGLEPALATDAVQVVDTRHAPLAEVFAAFEPRHARPQILDALKELRGVGALQFIGFRDEGLKSPGPQLPPMPFPQRTLVLNVANECNLGCSYCFAAQGDYNSPRRLMSEETARQSVDFLLANSGDHESVTLVFFGGEPLMNLGLIKKLVVYATEAGQKAGKRVEFSMTTNATYLTPEVIQFINDQRIGVSVSIDGPKKYHDLRRFYKGGVGSYDIIEPRVRALLKSHTTRPVAARATLTHGVTAVQECFWHLRELGFHEVGFAPVTSADRQDYALTSEELWAVLEEFKQLSELYVEKAIRNEYLGFSNLSNVLAELHAGIVKAYPCGAGLGLLGVGADGDLYLCHRFLESAEHRMGSVQQGLDVQKQAEFLQRAHLAQKAPCQVCWVRHVCSGGCHHESHTRYGDLYHGNPHYCEWIRTWIDMGLQAYVRIMDKNPGFIENFIDKRGT
jgi:uncharacterized protein